MALVERLPVWLVVRCGIEAKTVAALVVVLGVVLGFAVHHFWTGRPRTVAVPPLVAHASMAGTTASVAGTTNVPRPSPGPAASAPGTAKPAPLYVDVEGKVCHPGLRRLPSVSRVADALKAAGGALPGTDTSTLNLARVLTDGEQVLVGVPAPASGTTPATPGGASSAASGGAPGGAVPTAPISLSTATLEQLETLPGVGPVLAQHILDHRAQHGGFTSVDQLRDVTGIGNRRFAELEPVVRP